MSRKKELIKMMESRLEGLEFEMLLPPNQKSEKEFNEIITEALKLRELLAFLKKSDGTSI